MLTCPHCGQLLPDDAAFCNNCGNQVSPLPPQNPYTQQPSQNVYPQQKPQDPYPQQPFQNGYSQQPPVQQPVSYSQNPYCQPQLQQPVNGYYSMQPVPSGKKGVASLVLGIVALLSLCLLFAGNALYMCIGILPGIIGICLGVSARKDAKRTGTSSEAAMAGLVCSIVAVSIATLMLLIIVVLAVILVATDSTDILDDLSIRRNF